jgi:putative hydrolase of the HAD superfamily
MNEIYLFDWGDTLMVDFPNVPGKMFTWETVQAVSGAKETLCRLSKTAKLYIATGAADSTESDIKLAFERVGLSEYISGYFCKANVGFSKGEPEFLTTIVAMLNKPVSNIAMVGDNFEKDIQPALSAGINPIWFIPNTCPFVPDNVTTIKMLCELCQEQ